MGILRKYEKGSGLEVNLEKSLVFFSKNVPQSQQVHVCRKFENIRVVTQGKYLGLPMVISRSKQQIFGFIKEKCEKRMKHQKNKLLNATSKKVLLKAVTITMPTYVMSCFKLPVRLCKELSTMMSNFQWEKENEKRKTHWCSWQTLTQERKMVAYALEICRISTRLCQENQFRG